MACCRYALCTHSGVAQNGTLLLQYSNGYCAGFSPDFLVSFQITDLSNMPDPAFVQLPARRPLFSEMLYRILIFDPFPGLNAPVKRMSDLADFRHVICQLHKTRIRIPPGQDDLQPCRFSFQEKTRLFLRIQAVVISSHKFIHHKHIIRAAGYQLHCLFPQLPVHLFCLLFFLSIQ